MSTLRSAACWLLAIGLTVGLWSWADAEGDPRFARDGHYVIRVFSAEGEWTERFDYPADAAPRLRGTVNPEVDERVIAWIDRLPGFPGTLTRRGPAEEEPVVARPNDLFAWPTRSPRFRDFLDALESRDWVFVEDGDAGGSFVLERVIPGNPSDLPAADGDEAGAEQGNGVPMQEDGQISASPGNPFGVPFGMEPETPEDE